MTGAELYANQVLNGDILAPSYIALAAQRFNDWLDDPEITYDSKEAQRVIDWFENNLCLWEDDWEGQPFKLELWQQFIIQQIFGLKRDGRRLISKAYIQVPRKNAKTTLAAGIVDFHLIGDTQNTPQILVGASNEDQAKICTTTASKILKASPRIKPHIKAGNIKIHDHYKRTSIIYYEPKKGYVVPWTKGGKGKDGFNPSVGVVDEYHEAETDELLEAIRAGQGARKEPLLLVITTAGFNKDGPCYSILRRTGIEILQKQKHDDTQLVIIYEPDEDDDWEDETTWQKVNPNWGVSVFPHYMHDRYVEAKNEGASKEVKFKTKNLNVWTDSNTVWIQDDKWMANKLEPEKDLVYELGLDMAFKNDWCAAVLVGKNEGTGEYSVIPYFWIPDATIKERVKKENSLIEDWINQGLLFATEGDVTDHSVINDFILNLRNEYKINSCIADPAFAISTINALNAAGLECYELNQTPSKLTQPTNLFHEIVLKKKLRHGGHPILRWMMANVILKEYGSSNLVKITKENESGKIDGIDAIINGLVPFTIEKNEAIIRFDYV